MNNQDPGYLPSSKANIQRQSLDMTHCGPTTNIQEQCQVNNAHILQSSFFRGGSIFQQNLRQKVDNPTRYPITNTQEQFRDNSARAILQQNA